MKNLTKSKKWYLRECWRLMSLRVRSREGDYTNCITCGKLHHFKDLQAGHYIHNVLDYDDMNIQPQCVRCNKFKHGKLDEYTFYLIKTYGLKKVEDLRLRAKKALKGERYTIDELEKIYARLVHDSCTISARKDNDLCI